MGLEDKTKRLFIDKKVVNNPNMKLTCTELYFMSSLVGNQVGAVTTNRNKIKLKSKGGHSRNE